MTKITLTPRSSLFVPGNRPDRIDKAVRTPADKIIIDLEDAVVPTEKDAARAMAREKVRANPSRGIIVRVNSFASGLTELDVNEIATEGLFAVMLPKVEKSEDVVSVCKLLWQAENKNQLEIGSVKVIGLVESALGVHNISEVAASGAKNERFLTVAFGAVDYALDMGIDMTDTTEALLYPRSRIAVACHAWGLAAPIDTPYVTNIKDEKGIRLDATRAKQLGFGGKLCVHPLQVPICNEVFSPSSAEIAHAQKVVQAYEQAMEARQGVVQLDGKMIDLPVYERAKRILHLGLVNK